MDSAADGQMHFHCIALHITAQNRPRTPSRKRESGPQKIFIKLSIHKAAAVRHPQMPPDSARAWRKTSLELTLSFVIDATDER